MRISSAKAFPHPVLRLGSDDYADAEFQMIAEPVRAESSTALRLSIEFIMNDPGLSRLIEQRRAAYSVLVRCPATHFRRGFRTESENLTATFPAGALFRETEITAYLVALEAMSLPHNPSWHADFQDGREYLVDAGAVLALDGPEVIPVDHADDLPIGSIFTTNVDPHLRSGEWRVQLDGDQVVVMLRADDHSRLEAERARTRSTADEEYLISAVFLPALVHVLHMADRAPDEYSSCRWFGNVNARLSELDRDELGTDGANRVLDAQRIFDAPFRRLITLREA